MIILKNGRISNCNRSNSRELNEHFKKLWKK